MVFILYELQTKFIKSAFKFTKNQLNHQMSCGLVVSLRMMACIGMVVQWIFALEQYGFAPIVLEEVDANYLQLKYQGLNQYPLV